MAYNRSGGGMGPWAFILGAIVILVIGIIWYLGASSPAVAPQPAPAVITPGADVPDVDINNDINEPDTVDPDFTPDADVDVDTQPAPGTGGTNAPAPAD